MFREIESCIGRSVSNSETSISEDKNDLGIESYGISITTLEEVFLRVAGCDFDEAESVNREIILFHLILCLLMGKCPKEFPILSFWEVIKRLLRSYPP